MIPGVNVILQEGLHVGAEGGNEEEVGIPRVLRQVGGVRKEFLEKGVERIEDRIRVAAIGDASKDQRVKVIHVHTEAGTASSNSSRATAAVGTSRAKARWSAHAEAIHARSSAVGAVIIAAPG